MPSLVCVPITVQEIHRALEDAGHARALGADLVEFRVDEWFSGSVGPAGDLDGEEVRGILRLCAESPLPCIVTCRSASEGGAYDGDDMARVALYERLGTAGAGESQRGEHPPRYLDIEAAAYARSANLKQKVNLAVDHPAQERDVRTGLILSMHDFHGRPADLLRRIAAMQDEPAASVVKFAITARSVRDNLELFDLLADAGKPTIALAMGRFGLMSRVLAPKFGGFLTFASLRPASATAPGQPTVRELVDLYRFRSITRTTRVFGLVGWPVDHSMSPAVHNAGFEAGGFNGVYLPLPVPPEYEHFKATLSALLDHPRMDFSGCSVTLPHKQHLLRFAAERAAAGEEAWTVDELSELSGAANTLVAERSAGGRLVRCRVLNTDAAAAAGVVETALGQLATRSVAVVGAGGVARAVVAGFALRGARVVVHNRTLATAEALAAEIGAKVPGSSVTAAAMDALASRRFDAYVNATPIGMTGGPAADESPVPIADVARVSPGAVVFDTVYTPVRTPMLRAAEAAGLRPIDGVGMFVRQACDQFAAWTGGPAPAGLFDKIVRERLGAS
jgi:3-dehydroquinate dehydratase / shikimate dehydrogenase